MINLGKDRTISILSKSMDGSAIKQRVISDNIANINTPEYKRKYVDFESRLKDAIELENKKTGLFRTDKNHLSLSSSIQSIRPEIKTDRTASLREDGNNVDLDMELANLAENTIRFNTLSETVIKKYSAVKSAIRGGR